MKKRLLALLCALALAVQLCPGAAADKKVYITAVNDNVLPITDATMPFWSGGYLYVPSSLFYGKDLGVYCQPSGNQKTLVMYSSRRALLFNLEDGTTYDPQNSDNYYPEPAVVRNGQVFVPAGRVADYFGLNYSYMETKYGYLVRLVSRRDALSDTLFLDSASGWLTYRYEQYKEGSQATAPPPETPAETPDPEPAAPEGSQTVYLSLLAEDNEQTTALLDALGASRVAFYFPSALLESAGDLTRRMTAVGHSIGLWADASRGAGAALAQLEEGNRLLRRNTGGKTRLAVLEGASEQTLEEVRAAGWQVLEARVDGTGQGLRGSADASALLRRISAGSAGSVTVWLGGGATAPGLRAFLISLRAAEGRLAPMTELVA